MPDKKKDSTAYLEKLEREVAALKFELEDLTFRFQEEEKKRHFYQLIADFTFAWELWLDPGGKIEYCSPSCYDLTGYTSNEIINGPGIGELLVYEADKSSFARFLQSSLHQSLINQTLEFRILTRTKQLRWCTMNVRGVYDKLGKYLGIRASVQDISRMKRAMGQISNLEKGKEFDQRNRQRLQNQLELKDRELVSFLLQLSQKNDVLHAAENLVAQLNTANSSKQQMLIERLRKIFARQGVDTINWSVIENQVEKIHPGFLGRLERKHPSISAKDRKLCAYIRLGLSSKDIAGLMGITAKSVEISRVRLRKKLKLDTNIRLLSYLNQF